MHIMQSVDANLVLAFDAILREGSVTGAARRMNVTPPAMSHTLSRLRHAMGDPLFVRSGNRLVLTPRAVGVRERVCRVAGEIGALLRPEGPVDAATLDRAFVVRASDAVIVTLGRKLEVLVRREAPRVALFFVASSEGVEVDLDIGVQHGRRSDVRIQRLYEDELVVVARKGHPLAGRRISPKLLSTLERIAVLTKGREKGWRNDRTLRRVVPSYLAAAALVRESDAYTVLPARLAAVVFEAFGLRRFNVAEPGAKIPISQAWSAHLDNDTAHAWLRGCVRRASEESEPVISPVEEDARKGVGLRMRPARA